MGHRTHIHETINLQIKNICLGSGLEPHNYSKCDMCYNFEGEVNACMKSVHDGKKSFKCEKWLGKWRFKELPYNCEQNFKEQHYDLIFVEYKKNERLAMIVR